MIVHSIMEGISLPVVSILILLTELLKIPRRSLKHPLKKNCSERPNVGAQSWPFMTDEDLRGLMWIEKHHVLCHRVFNEKVFKVPKT